MTSQAASDELAATETHVPRRTRVRAAFFADADRAAAGRDAATIFPDTKGAKSANIFPGGVERCQKRSKDDEDNVELAPLSVVEVDDALASTSTLWRIRRSRPRACG